MDIPQGPVDHKSLAIHTQGLSKIYKGTTVLKSLDLSVPLNTTCAFLGPNGAGKTTAIKLLLGLARPTGGSGTIFGHDIMRDSIAIRRRIGYLPQKPRFYDDLTARETLRFVARFFFPGSSSLVEDRIAQMLELAGLTDKADRQVKWFSDGERQRLGIAQAQISAPDLLILDEPTAWLDPVGRHDVLEVMQRLHQQTTIFYATHLLDDVERVSDWIVMLKEGNLILQAPLQSLLMNQDTITYTITLQGATQETYRRLAQQSWVEALTILTDGDPAVWQVTVSDIHATERSLFTSLFTLFATDSQVRVLGFGRKKHALEDIFVTLMKEKIYA